MMTYAVAGGVFLMFLFAVWLICKVAEGKGRSDAENERLLREARMARRASEIDEDVRHLPDADLDRELCNGSRMLLVKADRDE
jgi:hypothetical protein